MKIIDIPQTTVELLEYRLHDADPWPVPADLKENLQPVAPFDPDLLPDILRDYVMDSSHRMQSPLDFVAVSCLAALGAIIGAGCGVRPKQQDDWYELPNLWGAVIGGPSSMKTPSISAGIEPLGWLEHDANSDYEQDMACFTIRKLEYEHELKQLKADKAAEKLGISAAEVQQRMRTLVANPPKEPRLRRYKSNDATIEMAAELIRDNPRGMLLIRDELTGLLNNCNRQGHEGDRAFYLEGWNGKHSFMTDRIGRGSILVPNLCLSIFGGIQPAKLQEYIWGAVAGHDNDGLLQRFQLMVYPDPSDKWSYVDQQRDTEARDRLIAIARRLAKADFIAWGAEQDDIKKTPCFRFCPKVQTLFVEWLTGLEKKIREVEHPIMAEHLSKYRKLIPALALIFHLVDQADKQRPQKANISKAALQRAIRWGEYLESHAKRIYSIVIDARQPAIQVLAGKIKTGKLQDGFSERDVYKAGWANLSDPDLVHAVCSELEQDGWLRRVKADKGAGRPASPSYLINPQVAAK